MKIGIYSPYLDTLTGGEKYILTMATSLAQRHEVDIFWNLKEEKQIREGSSSKLGINLDNITFVENVFQKNVSIAKRLLTTRKYDGCIVLSDGSIPVVASDLILHFQFPVEWVNGNALKTKLKIKRVKKIICNSDFTKKYIDKTFVVNSAVLYPPVPIVKKDSKNKKNIILNVGRFGLSIEGVYYKKQDILIDAFKKLVDEGLKDWRFVLVISVKSEEQLRLKELQKKVDGYPIEFVINPTHKRLWDEYSQAKIYWHASGYGENIEKNPEKAEHFGISTVEAMGAGVVPVVINKGGQPEIVTDGVNGFVWDTIEELVEKTMLLSRNTQEWKKLSSTAEERAQDFNRQIFDDRVEELIG